jgi:hypothetical protein
MEMLRLQKGGKKLRRKTGTKTKGNKYKIVTNVVGC